MGTPELRTFLVPLPAQSSLGSVERSGEKREMPIRNSTYLVPPSGIVYAR